MILQAGTLMAVNMFLAPHSESENLCLLGGYEDGRVALFRFTGSRKAAFEPPEPGIRQEEAEGWELVWDVKGHREARASSFTAKHGESVN